MSMINGEPEPTPRRGQNRDSIEHQNRLMDWKGRNQYPFQAPPKIDRPRPSKTPYTRSWPRPECPPVKLTSIDSIPARWSINIGIDSIDWFTICFYRWYFNNGDELMESWTCEWNLRKFWKVEVMP